MGLNCGLGRRASWAVHGIGAWVVHGCMAVWWSELVGATSYGGCAAFGGFLEMTTYNRLHDPIPSAKN